MLTGWGITDIMYLAHTIEELANAHGVSTLHYDQARQAYPAWHPLVQTRYYAWRDTATALRRAHRHYKAAMSKAIQRKQL